MGWEPLWMLFAREGIDVATMTAYPLQGPRPLSPEQLAAIAEAPTAASGEGGDTPVMQSRIQCACGSWIEAHWDKHGHSLLDVRVE
jgi:hypothetical protein